MLEVKEFFLYTSKEKFLSNEYVKDIEKVYHEFIKGNKNAIKDKINLFRDTTRLVFGIEMSDKEVVYHWENIFDIRKGFPNYDIRIISFDYFLNNHKIYNPKIIEMEKFIGLLETMLQDSKTLAYNYNMMKILINYEIERIKRYSGYFSVILIDLDNFKYYNDTHGHRFGDEILSEFSKIVISNMRKSDLLFRYGGDEFVVFCPETKRIGARIVAERIREGVETYFKQKNIQITTSIGISSFPFDGENFDEIMNTADKMLYFSKSRGKNRITDRFDYVDQEDRRTSPRLTLEKPSKVFLRINNQIVEGALMDISKSGMLIKTNNTNYKDISIITLDKIMLGDSEFVLEVPVKVERCEGLFLAINFKDNKILETLVYLFDK
ncbi:MAG: diguanylate cyclase [Brevinematales bacterium]|nr:diguanylate cyclase [Brevinematales bacterium]